MPETDGTGRGGGLEQIMADRKAKAARLAALGHHPFANHFRPDSLAADVLRDAQASLMAGSNGELARPGPDAPRRSVAGRIVALRSFGKAAFVKLDDRSGRIQVHVRRDVLPESDFAAFRLAEAGDFAGVRGPVFRTRTGEVTVLAERWVHLTKALRPPPEKWHGLTDIETRLRHRCVDLFAHPHLQTLFRARARIISALREYLDREGFLEVETPMLHTVQGGAAARPFLTHHNALDLDLFLRIAPELYLKRLLVGGLERVYEIGRCFRNEGISTRHNPEFTILEFYEAYATCETVMDRAEELLVHTVRRLDEAFPEFAARRRFSLERPFLRVPMADALADRGVPREALSQESAMTSYLEEHYAGARAAWSTLDHGSRTYWLFETLVVPTLGPEPTFIVGYPTAVSPLARPRDDDPAWADRFELFLGGEEVANAFSELNDPVLQAERFRAQVEARKRGDEEAMGYDEEYVQALEYGMPPAGGFGLGVDRLVMQLCGVDSIREAILFPLRRPARPDG